MTAVAFVGISMTQPKAQCLILACGNSLREDDGVGPWLAEWASARFHDQPQVRVLSRQQWTPELAEEIAASQSVIFLDCSAESAPGLVKLAPVGPTVDSPGLATHHLDAGQLLTLAFELYDSRPRNACLLTIGAGALGLREGFSAPVQSALPEATRQLERSVLEALSNKPA
jgi:hydrogenase maturation protease